MSALIPNPFSLPPKNSYNGAMPPSPRPRRTQAERTQQRKEQLIRAAIRYFGQYGYHGAKLSEIARAAGVTEPGLLHHFPSKEQLLMDVLAERDRLDRQRFDPSVPGQAGGVLAALQALDEYNQSVPGLVQLFTMLVAESVEQAHPGHAYFLQRYQDLRKDYTPLVQAGQARGEIRQDIPAEDLVRLLFALMDGLQIQWLYEPESFPMAKLFDQFVKLLKPV